MYIPYLARGRYTNLVIRPKCLSYPITQPRHYLVDILPKLYNHYLLVSGSGHQKPDSDENIQTSWAKNVEMHKMSGF